MNDSDPERRASTPPPMSSLDGPFEQWIRAGALDQPPNPGLLASVGDYGIERPLDKGASAFVFLAVRLGGHGRVAIKMLRPEHASHPESVAQFIRSATISRDRLDHPHIVPVLDLNDRPEGPYIVMPYYEQGSLAEHIRDGQPLPSGKILAVAADIAAALHHIHANGLIHHDVKPGNVLLDHSGRASLADFGLARTLFNDPILDKDAHGAGTAPYVSPRVANGEAEDTRGDIYSFGAVLYHMLTGRPPYKGQNSNDIRAKIRAGPPSRAAGINPKAPTGLTAICEGAMARKLCDRYASMEDVIEDLRRVSQGDQPIGPRGHGSADRRGRLVVGSFVVAALVAGVCWGFWPRPEGLLHVGHVAPLGGDHAWAGAQLGDWNGDMQADLCTIASKTPVVYAFNPSTRVVGHRLTAARSTPVLWLDAEKLPIPELPLPVSSNVALAGLADVRGHVAQEMLINYSRGEEINLVAVAQNCEDWVGHFQIEGTIAHEGIGGRPQTTSMASFPPQAVKLYGDDRRQLLAFVTTPWGHAPRGLACFDLDSAPTSPQAPLWLQSIAGIPAVIQVVDLDGDSHCEVALGSYAVCNGHDAPDGTTDYASYLYLIEANGNLKWRQCMGDEFTSCRPFLVRETTNAAPRLYAWMSGSAEVRSVPRFFVGDIADPLGLARRLVYPADPLSIDLSRRVPPNAQEALASSLTNQPNLVPIRRALVRVLKHHTASGPLFNPVRFRDVALSRETEALMRRRPEGRDLAQLNQMLLEDAFPAHLSSSRIRRQTNGFPGKPTIGRIFCLDAQGNTVAAYEAGACLESCHACDLDRDGRDEILATDRAGYLHVLTPRFTERRRIRITLTPYTGVLLSLVTVTNLAPGGKPHLVLSSSQYNQEQSGIPGPYPEFMEIWSHHHEEIVVLDTALHTVLRQELTAHARQSYGENWLRAADLDGDGAAELLVFRDAVTIYKMR